MSSSDKDTPKSSNRRFMLGAAAFGVAAWWGLPRVAPLFAGGFDFEPMSHPAGFRRLAAGETSGFPGLLVGLDASERGGAPEAERAVRDDLCSALFGQMPREDVLPIASFSDYNCPYCRILTEKLVALEARSDGLLHISWHEWPLLGPTSHIAARAALAADLQGAYAAFHKRLMRSRLVPTQRYIALVAEESGLDAQRMLADMEGPEVARRLQITAALAGTFGFVGTPALIVGRTVVVGAISEARLSALIAREQRDGPLAQCCA